MQIKMMLYNSLILPHNVLIIVFHTQRIITLRKYNSHTEPLYIQTVEHAKSRRLQQLKFYFR